MSAIVFAPHNDDETLFAAYPIQAERAAVYVVLRSFVEAERWPDAEFHIRELETADAVCELLGPDAVYQQWAYPDTDPPWDAIADSISAVSRHHELVFAPLPEEGGHDHHNRLGEIVAEICGRRSRFYSTYTRQGGRSEVGRKVQPRPEWVVAKLRALACYRSQIAIDQMRPHFERGLDEFVSDA